MGDLSFTSTEINKILDGRRNSFRQAVADAQYTVGSPRAMSASTEYLLTNDGLGAAGSTTAPAYITSRWEATNSKIAIPEELDQPTYTGDVSFTFDPTVAAASKGTLRVYIDNSGTRDFTADPLIRTYRFDYKAAPEPVSGLTSWFFGESTGYDAKNDGVYFTVEFDTAGALYDTYMSIYRT